MTVYVLKDLTKKETNVFKVKNFNCRVVKIVDSHEKFMSTFCHILAMGVVAIEQTSRLDHQPLLKKGARASYERRVRT
mgnify:CR=1 FL=1